jgi:hypothetical protein
MSSTGNQSPLGVNVVSSLLQGQGFAINPTAAGLMGSSTDNATYIPGSIVTDTCLNWLTNAINQAYQNLGAQVSDSTYNNLISIGANTIPALGNSVPPTYTISDPSGVWSGQATSGYPIAGDIGQGQSATWLPYSTNNPNDSVTQWGFIRLLALQAWNEFNWNSATVVSAGSFVVGTTYSISFLGTTDFTSIGATTNTVGVTFVATGAGTGTGTAACVASTPSYKDFTSSFLTFHNFATYSNKNINTVANSTNFQKGTFSNQNDLITGDLSGVTLSMQDFGQDLINLGKALNISQINKFGLPSTVLQLIKQHNAQTKNLNLALLSSGLGADDVENISNGSVTPTKQQEQQIYSALSIVRSSALDEVLVPLSCKTKGLTSLADLLNVQKLFPLSHTSMTVPSYNTTPGPTNSKTYYPLFSQDQVNSQLTSPSVAAKVASVTPPAMPPIAKPVTAPYSPQSAAITASVTSGAAGSGSVIANRFINKV